MGTVVASAGRAEAAPAGDRVLMQALADLSSSLAARSAAAAWIGAYDHALADGAAEDEAQTRAEAAWRAAALGLDLPTGAEQAPLRDHPG